MTSPAGPRPADATSPPSARSDVDDTAAAVAPAAGTAAPGFGPPAAAGEVGTLGPYRVVKELGRGGMGAVYAAIDTRLDRRLALKVMLPQFAADPASRERFLREAKAAAKVKHDNVVTVYEADERAGVPYIAMEFLEGYPFDEYLKKKGNPTPAQVLRVAAEAAAGLAAAHRQGLVHRDVKPGNLWLEAPNGRVKVLDFGLAKPVEAEVELTKSGAVVGTPAYMSPEQARGLKVDHRTDLFSLGAVLYRLLTGRLPFPGDTAMAVLMALASEEPAPVRGLNPAVPEELAALVHQLLAKAPDARPASADEVVRRVRAIGQSLAAARARAMEQSTSQPQVIPSQVAPASLHVTAHEANPFADLDAPDTEPDAVPEAAPVGRKPGGKTLAVALGLAALVLMVFGGVIIIIRNRDGTETKIEVPDGATVTVKKDGKTLAKVGPGTPPAVKDDGADRKTAEWVLSLGGRVGVNGDNTQSTTAVADLPRDGFRLTAVNLNGKDVSDADLSRLRECREVASLGLVQTKVTDAGLAHLAAHPSLTLLHVAETAVSDAGLVHLKGCPRLHTLFIASTRVTDRGMAELVGFKNLNDLTLYNTAVTDAGLAALAKCPALAALDVRNTKVTANGVSAFHAALPGCKVTHDGGVIEPVDVDRRAAEWVLSVGGVVGVQVDGAGRNITAAADLPRERFVLTDVGLNDEPVTDDGLAKLARCSALGAIYLKGTKVSDAGLAHLRNCKEMKSINLDGTAITDAGLVHARNFPKLNGLDLARTAVTDAGLADLAKCPALAVLDVRGTKVTAAGLAAFHAAVPGCRVQHDGGVIEPKK